MIGNLADDVMFFIRLALAFAGALITWYIAGPPCRLLYQVAFGHASPKWLVPWLKLIVSGLVGLVLFCVIHFGLVGGAGFGLGGGEGLGTGAGTEGEGKKNQATTKNSANVEDPPRPVRPPSDPRKTVREVVEIELLGGPRYQGDERYYLLQRTTPAKNLKEIEEVLKKRADSIEVHIVLTKDSVGLHHGATSRLRRLTEEYRIPVVLPQ